MNHSESENTLREAGSLVGKIVYNDTNVFRRLRISDVDDDLVAVCAHSFEQQNKREIERLVNLDHQASMKLKQVRKQEADEMVEVHKLLVCGVSPLIIFLPCFFDSDVFRCRLNTCVATSPALAEGRPNIGGSRSQEVCSNRTNIMTRASPNTVHT